MANLNSIYTGAVDVNKGGSGGRWMTGMALAQQLLGNQQLTYHAPSWVRRADLEHAVGLSERSVHAAHLRTMQLEKSRHQQIMQRTRHAGRMLGQLRDQGIQVGSLHIDADGSIKHSGIVYTTPKSAASPAPATAKPAGGAPSMTKIPYSPTGKKAPAASTVKKKIKASKGVKMSADQLAMAMGVTGKSGGKK